MDIAQYLIVGRRNKSVRTTLIYLHCNKQGGILVDNYTFQNATCAQSVNLLQNSEMFENTSCVQSVYLLQSYMFQNDIKNHREMNVIY